MEGQCLQCPYSVYWSGKKGLTCQVPGELSGLACSVPTSVGSQERTPLCPTGHLQFLSPLPGKKSSLAGWASLKMTTRQDPWNRTLCPSQQQCSHPLHSATRQGLQPQLSSSIPSGMEKHVVPLSGALRAPLT